MLKRTFKYLTTKNKVKFGFKKSYNQNVPAIIESLNLSIKLAKQKKVAGIVTLPVMKKTLIINGFNSVSYTHLTLPTTVIV